ncbi:hypothetical protein PR202_gb28373 [Eleusine coracana subsp. coracana]|uniref:Mediator of RNA polymerase II transcription subunit 36b n=1 Tax=Eleusine coracana subsp. coracana TaxID=191504 RepID=A0AAV5FXA0_ELECO|nr:hypothetical protein PR202_gb28373 [Eleusine coracana subsp. coracana]
MMKGGSKAVVVPHRHDGVFISKSKEDALCTRNMVPGESVYGEKRVSVQNEDGTKVEYRVWNPFRSKLAAAVLGGVDDIWIARILALNASYFLKTGGHFVISIKGNCIDCTIPAEAVFASEVEKLKAEQLKPSEQVTLDPFERDHACVVGGYRMPKKQKPSPWS